MSEFQLSQDQTLLQETIRQFAQEEISSAASKIDWEARIPAEISTKLPSLGLYGISVPAEFGGAGADFLSLVLVTEELSKVSGSVGARISLHNAVVCDTLLFSTNNHLKTTLLPKLASGNVGAFIVDPKSTISCTVEKDQIILDGSCEFVLNADSASVLLVLAKMKGGGSNLVCFSEEDLEDSSGLKISEPKKLLGMRAAGTAKIEFHNVRLPLNSTVFEPEVLPAGLNRIHINARLAVAAQALGIAQAALDAEVKYANERVQFNTKIGKFYAVQDFIAQDQIAVQTARLVTYKTAAEMRNLRTLERDSAVAKVSSSNAAVQTARHSIRVHGGYGFIRDYPVERYLRDARVTQVYLESNESLKAKIAESLL
jgi:alkylation response protein AidB-like acyl-CoA dehydrogenase